MRAAILRGRGRVLAITLAGMLVAAGASADSRIELRDGSVLRGELIGVDEGGYRVRTETLGVINVPEAEVRSIRPNAAQESPLASPPDPAAGDYRPEISGIQQQMLGDPGIMSAIGELQNDPELKAALADPELARLVLSGDLARLRSDPRFQRLLEHPAIQAIVGQMTGTNPLP